MPKKNETENSIAESAQEQLRPMKGPQEYPLRERAPGSPAPSDTPERTINGVIYPAIRGEIRTAEGWAEAKGMLPQLVPIAQPFARADAPPAFQHNPEFWKYHAASVAWPIGKELTEAEFDAAVDLAINGHQYR